MTAAAQTPAAPRPSRRATSIRGALAGASAAAVWAAQQPLDKRVFAFGFDDVELLGKAVTRGPCWLVAGTAMHLANGAAFGAVYANAQPHVRGLPLWARGPAAALAEHLASWPATALTDRFHPARDELPALRGSSRGLHRRPGGGTCCSGRCWGSSSGGCRRRFRDGRARGREADAIISRRCPVHAATSPARLDSPRGAATITTRSTCRRWRR